MPNTNRLSKGCKVEGKVGPLGEAPDGGKRRQRTVLTGWIIGSGEKENWWRVFWIGVRLISDHPASKLTYKSRGPSDTDMIDKAMSIGNLLEQEDVFVKDQAGLDKAMKKQRPNRNQGTANVDTPSPVARAAQAAVAMAPAPREHNNLQRRRDNNNLRPLLPMLCRIMYLRRSIPMAMEHKMELLQRQRQLQRCVTRWMITMD